MIPFEATTTTPVFCFAIGGDMHSNPHWSCEWQCAGRALTQFKIGDQDLALFLPNDARDPASDTELVSIYDLAFPGQVPFRRVRSAQDKGK